MLPCPTFDNVVASIVVGPAGGTFAVTRNGRSTITFAAGAVTTETTFTVNSVIVDGRKLAGVGFTPGTGEFPQPVVLRLSYAGCPDILEKEHGNLHIVRLDGTDDPPSLGGVKSTQHKYVQAVIDHFTDFAIAL